MILHDITQDNNKVPEEKINKNSKLHRLERGMEEAVHTFQSMVKTEQRIGGPQQKRPILENENPSRILNKGQGMGQATKIQKEIECHPIAIWVEAREEEYRKKP